MTLPDLISALDSIGAKVSVDLLVSAPSGAITPELRAALAEHKGLIAYRVARELAWGGLLVQRWGPQLGSQSEFVSAPEPVHADVS